MLLSEAEIKQMIADALPSTAWSYMPTLDYRLNKAAHAIAEAEAEKMQKTLVGEMAAIDRHMEVTPKDSKWFMWNHGYRDCLDALLHQIPIEELLDLQKEE